jgi:hypothetical protein
VNSPLKRHHIGESLIASKEDMNVLVMPFDSKLKCEPQASRAIKEANKALQPIKMIKSFFSP